MAFYAFIEDWAGIPVFTTGPLPTIMGALSLFKKASFEHAHAAEESDSFTRGGGSGNAGSSKGSKGMGANKRARAELRNIHSTLGPQWAQPMAKMRKRTPLEISEMMPSGSIPSSALSSRIHEKKPTKGSGKQGAMEVQERKGLEGLSALTESTLPMTYHVRRNLWTFTK